MAISERQSQLLVTMLAEPARFKEPWTFLSLREKRIAIRLKNQGLVRTNRAGGYVLTPEGRVIAEVFLARLER